MVDVVLAELVWVLGGKRCRLEGPAIREVIVGLLEDRRIVFEDPAAVWTALGQFAKAGSGEASSSGPDFADALIVSKGAAAAARLERPCRPALTSGKWRGAGAEARSSPRAAR